MRIQNRIRPLHIRDIINRHLKLRIIRLIELASQPIRRRTHALQQKRHAEQVHALGDENVNGGFIDELIVDAEAAGQACAVDAGGGVDAEFAAGFVYAGVVDFGVRGEEGGEEGQVGGEFGEHGGGGEGVRCGWREERRKRLGGRRRR